MQTDILVMRHAECGAAFSLVNHIPNNVHIINAGDGQHEHPTQALLDMCTILKHKCLTGNIEDFANLRVAIVGDILHSRVARSNIFALSILGCTDIRLIAPPTLLPKDVQNLGVTIHYDMKKGLENVDVIIMLRLQNERMQSGLIPSKQQYFDEYGLDKLKLSCAKPDAIVMHPGPINRGVEISTEVADGKQSLILKQVQYGIAVRMAVMQSLIQDQKNYENSN
jgi:aspartate carbamoyltransferase catalytic subunit